MIHLRLAEKRGEAIGQGDGTGIQADVSAPCLPTYLDTSAKDTDFVHDSGRRKSEAQRTWGRLSHLLERWKAYESQLFIMGDGRNSYSKTDEDSTFMRLNLKQKDRLGNPFSGCPAYLFAWSYFATPPSFW